MEQRSLGYRDIVDNPPRFRSLRSAEEFSRDEIRRFNWFGREILSRLSRSERPGRYNKVVSASAFYKNPHGTPIVRSDFTLYTTGSALEGEQSTTRVRLRGFGTTDNSYSLGYSRRVANSPEELVSLGGLMQILQETIGPLGFAVFPGFQKDKIWDWGEMEALVTLNLHAHINHEMLDPLFVADRLITLRLKSLEKPRP